MLTKKQIKFIRKNYLNLDTAGIAAKLNLNMSEVEAYIIKHLGKVKKAPVIFSIQHSPQNLIMLFRQSLWSIILLIVLTYAAYANGASGEFVMDDIAYLVRNDHISSFQFVLDTPISVGKAFVNWLTFHAAGLNPTAFHIVNLIYHMGSVVLVFLLASLLFNKRTGLIAALLAAVHPLFTESVTWIGGGGYVIYGFYFLLSLLLYVVSYNNKILYSISIIFFILALLTSEKAVTLSLVFPIYELCTGSFKRNWKRTVPYLALTAVWLILIFFITGFFQTQLKTYQKLNYNAVGFYNPLVQIPIAISTYIESVFRPDKQAFFHSQLAFTIEEYVLRTGMFLVFLALTLWGWIKNRRFFFWLCVIMISLIPSFSPIIISWMVAERYFYLGGIASMIMLAVILDRLFKERRIALIIFTLILVVFLGFRTYLRNRDWLTPEALAIATAKTSPNDARVRNNIGSAYLSQGQPDQAEIEFNKALAINPRYAPAYYNLGLVAESKKDYVKSVDFFKKAIETNPTFSEPYQYLSSKYYDEGQYESARLLLEKAISYGNKTSQFYTNLGLVYNKLGDKTKAVQNLEEALKLQPDNEFARSWIIKITSP